MEIVLSVENKYNHTQLNGVCFSFLVVCHTYLWYENIYFHRLLYLLNSNFMKDMREALQQPTNVIGRSICQLSY